MNAVSFFDIKARHRRRDELVEESLSVLNSLRSILDSDKDHVDLVNAIESTKKLRRPEVVERLDAERMKRALQTTS